MPPPKLSTKQTIKLVKLYKETECLWNAENEKYRSKCERDAALKYIKDSLGVPHMREQDIKLKLKYLRATFAIEHKKVIESQKADGGPVHVPKLIWYNDMASFINPAAGGGGARKSVEMLDASIPAKHESVYLQAFEDKQDDVESQCSSNNIPSENEDTNRGPHWTKLYRSSNVPNMGKSTRHMSHSSNALDVDDEYEAFGRHVSCQLRQLSVEQYLHAQDEIQSVITRCRLHDLQNRNE